MDDFFNLPVAVLHADYQALDNHTQNHVNMLLAALRKILKC